MKKDIKNKYLMMLYLQINKRNNGKTSVRKIIQFWQKPMDHRDR